ncbi:MAG TPA: histidine kinase [Pyrinomonadaceae bacterium]|nr:histidine kinase [Pyrinomonadaceae bacterium]
MMETHTIESLDERLINFTRLVLALSALIIIYVDPSEPDRFVKITYTTLALYTVYSASVYFLSARPQSAFRGVPLYWLDVAWYVVLVSLSSGTNSLFFFFFFFAILVASFRSGYRAGLEVTIVSATLFVTIGYFTTPTSIEPNRFLLRPVCLASIGYLMAYWGGSETTHKRRLALLKDVSRSANPRFGVDQTIGSIMRKLREFYDADTCLVINTSRVSDAHILRRVDRSPAEFGNRVESVGTEAAQLLTWPPEWAVTWHSRSEKRWFRKTVCYSYDFFSGERVKDADCETYAFVADLLASESFITIPIYQRNTFAGRLYLTTKERAFNYSDVDFLRQVMDHVMPMIDNIHLVDRLALQASEHERQRISRDIHDSAIQPYIGLKLGLEALRRNMPTDEAIAGGLAELIERTDSVIRDLRTYVGDLQGPGTEQRMNVLTSSVENHAKQLGEFYGIAVDVKIATTANMNERLAAEIFQIVREGLSNIKRHTNSAEARIRMTSANGDVVLDIENDSSAGESRTSFRPRSITERALALGGRVSVNVGDERCTTVSVVIPM